MKKIILKSLTAISIIVLLIGCCAVNFTNWVYPVVMLICGGFLTLMAYANGWFGKAKEGKAREDK